MKISHDEEEAVRTYIKRCYTIYERKGKGGLVDRCTKLWVEVRRLSKEVERLQKENKELNNEL